MEAKAKLKGLWRYRKKKKQQPLLSIAYSSSGGSAKTIGIPRACYICWLLLGLEWNSIPGSNQQT
jgi:hypothetical protein